MSENNMWVDIVIANVRRSARTLKPMTGDVNSIEDLITMATLNCP